MDKVDRCTGHCCRRFCLPMSYYHLMNNYKLWMAQKEMDQHVNDIHLIAPMVVYLGHLRSGDQDEGLERNENPDELGHYYRCKHLDETTNDCTIYDIRPQMCRDYPNSGTCKYNDCTWEAVKRKEQES